MHMCFALEFKIHDPFSFKFTSLLCSCFKGSLGSDLEGFWLVQRY